MINENNNNIKALRNYNKSSDNRSMLSTEREKHLMNIKSLNFQRQNPQLFRKNHHFEILNHNQSKTPMSENREE